MIELTDKPIDINEVIQSVAADCAGAVVPFIGSVREEKGLKGIFYEGYDKMVSLILEKIREEVLREFPLHQVSIVHRLGWVPVGEASLVIAVSAPHRDEAFKGCRAVIEAIKRDAPIWKRKITDVMGVVLAGGKSTRFGVNKAFAVFDGVSFIGRTLETMKMVFEEVILVTNTPDVYSGCGVPVVKDSIPYRGPIGGLMSALSYAVNRPVFITACDMPLLNPADIRRIINQGKNSLAAVPVHDGRKEYLMAFYSQKILPLVSSMIGEEKLSMTGLVSKLESVAWVPVQGESCLNVNTPEDLTFLEERHAP